MTSPSKSYVVNPIEGKIDYKLAYRDIDKFAKKVQNQPITKYRISPDREQKNPEEKWYKNPNDIEKKRTKRPLMNKEGGVRAFGAINKRTKVTN